MKKYSYSQYTGKELKVTVVVNEISKLTSKPDTGSRFDERQMSPPTPQISTN